VTRHGADEETIQASGERISLERALKAITVDAAYVLGMEQEIGSIEVGKRADFAVLGDDPLTTDIAQLRNIDVWGTVLDGVKQPG
jgi:predicted amidohydrolase YtcJ